MRRPRHRVKSNLLWKMLGLAALVNLLLWPVLIRLGVFGGIRRELLLPVTLVSPPAPPKAPDALAKVPKPFPAASRRTPRVASAPPSSAKRLVASSSPGVSKPFVTASVAPVRHSAHPMPSAHPPQKVAQAAPRKIMPTRAVAAHSTHPARLPRSVVATTVSSTHYSLSSLVEARRERAARLERAGHQIAEQIAAERAAWLAQHPLATVLPKPPEKVTVTPPPAPNPPPDAVSAPPAPSDNAGFSPALAVVQVQPSVPESMQNSVWQASFRGVFMVDKEGSFTVRMTSSTGFPVLDERALNAARKWKFRPATEGGLPVASAVHFKFDYAVNAAP